LRENGCLAASFHIEIYASGVVFVWILVICVPVVGVLSFLFLLELQQFFSERSMLENIFSMVKQEGIHLCWVKIDHRPQSG
jgi:hypothetical protein